MKKLLLIFPLIILFTNCNKDIVKEDNYGIEGHVYVVPEFADWSTEYKIGNSVLVSLEYTELTTITKNGEFLFENLPLGSYNICFSRNGCSNFKIYNKRTRQIREKSKSFNWGFADEYYYLFKKSSTIVESDLSVEVDNEKISFFATINQPSTEDSLRYFFIFINDNENVSMNEYKYCSSIEPILQNQNMEQIVNINDLSLSIVDFEYNKTYYAVAYGASNNKGYSQGKAKYYDIDKGIWIYMGLNDNSSNIVSFSISSQ